MSIKATGKVNKKFTKHLAFKTCNGGTGDDLRIQKAFPSKEIDDAVVETSVSVKQINAENNNK